MTEVFLSLISSDSIELLKERIGTWSPSKIDRQDETLNKTSLEKKLKDCLSLNLEQEESMKEIYDLLAEPLYNKFFNRKLIHHLFISNILSEFPDTQPKITKEKSYDGNLSLFKDFISNLSYPNQNKELIVYISSFTSQFFKVDKFITELYCLLNQYCLSGSIFNSFKLIALEDLFTLKRAYIHDTKSVKLYSALSDKAEKSDNFSFISTNEFFNSWAEGDVKIIKLDQEGIKALKNDPPTYSSLDDVTFSLNLSEQDDQIWHDILSEVNFSKMMNQGNPVPRLISLMVASQKHSHLKEDGTTEEFIYLPYYRHPHDNFLPIVEMTPTVLSILKNITKNYDNLDLNHVLIQLYRDGNDTIAAHSDKTLDIDSTTPIFNFSLGSTRTMTLQNKKNKNIIENIPLRHMECVEFGLKTNQIWWHEIKKQPNLIFQNIAKNKMNKVTQNPWETSRISFTFRKVSSYLCLPKQLLLKLDSDQNLSPFEAGYKFDIELIMKNLETFPFSLPIILGQGSPFKTYEDYAKKINSLKNTPRDQFVSTELLSSESLINAFSQQNKQSEEFDWEAVYGKGFYIIN